MTENNIIKYNIELQNCDFFDTGNKDYKTKYVSRSNSKITLLMKTSMTIPMAVMI